jgi:hypothetical protein
VATFTGKLVQFAAINAVALGDNAIVAAVPGQRIKVLSYVLVADAAVAVAWRSAANPLSGPMPIALNGGIAAPPVDPAIGCWLQTAAGEALNLNLGLAAGVRGHMSYLAEA